MYFYDGNLQSTINAENDYFSYFLKAHGPRFSSVNLSSIPTDNRDQHLPLISLQLCKWNGLN